MQIETNSVKLISIPEHAAPPHPSACRDTIEDAFVDFSPNSQLKHEISPQGSEIYSDSSRNPLCRDISISRRGPGLCDLCVIFIVLPCDNYLSGIGDVGQNDAIEHSRVWGNSDEDDENISLRWLMNACVCHPQQPLCVQALRKSGVALSSLFAAEFE
jgi:hypothetical protein